MARRVRGARDPGRLRQRLALQRDRRPLDPPDAGRRLRRRSSPMSARCPGTWREGDAICLAGEPELSLDGSEYQALYGELGGTRPPLDLARRGRARSRSLWRAAPRCSLVHDVVRGRPRGRARGGRARGGHRRRARPPDDALTPVRRRRRPGGRRLRLERVDAPGVRSHSASVGGEYVCSVFPSTQLRRAWGKVSRTECAASSAFARPTATSRGVTYFGLFALQHRGQESAGSPSPTAAA